MREYETTFIVQPEISDDVRDAFLAKLDSVVADKGGVRLMLDDWGKRKLAYEIGHKADGTYVLIEFTSEPGPLPEMERLLTLADEVIRHKVIKRAA